MNAWLRPTFPLVAMAAVASLTAACGDDEGELASERGTGDNDAAYGGVMASDALLSAPSEAGVDPNVGADVDESKFEAVGTNPFVLTAYDPLSTFAADVDTASYTYFRTSVRDYSQLPPADSVRLEEFVNYFDYDYEGPSADDPHPFSIHLKAAPNLVTRKTTLLRVGIQGLEVPPEEKKPANLVFLVDTSGSMQEEMDMVKSVLDSTVDLLDPTDTIAIVAYAGVAGTVLEATPVSDAQTITSAIDNLVSGGGTNGAGGIDAAYAEAESAFIEGGINHVLLCTDGDFNVGPASIDELETLIEEKRATGITLTGLGFGYGNYSDGMMERITNAGDGIYGYIGSEQDAARYVEGDLLQTLVHIAKDMKIQVEFNPDHVHAYRLLGYENRAIADEDFRNDVVDAGEIGSGHQVTALYELVLSESEMPEYEGAPAAEDGAAYDGAVEVAAEDLVLLKVRYKEPGASETDAAEEVSATMTPEAVESDFDTAAGDLQWAAAVASFAEILKNSPYADEDALDAIELVLDEGQGLDQDRMEFVQLVEQSRQLLGK